MTNVTLQPYSSALGTPSDSGVLSLAKTINAAVRASNVVTYTTTAAHGFIVGERVQITGLTADYNSPIVTTLYSTVDSVPSPTTFTCASIGADGAAGDQDGSVVPVSFTGTTPPSGTENHYYWWHRIGNTVHFMMIVDYSVAGVALTAATLALPPDMPAPYVPAGRSGTNDIIAAVRGVLQTTASSLGATTAAVLRKTSATSGYWFALSASSGNYLSFVISGSYRAA